MLKRLVTFFGRRQHRMMSTVLSHKVSPQQIDQLNDRIPTVNELDEVIGPSTKKECHIRPPTKESDGLLHRAFSVFLFNSKKELLLQQRSSSKITFPDHFTNTCCSHPRYNKDELNEKDGIGIKIAAQRRLKFELGIKEEEIPLNMLDLLTRIHYSGISDETWCEHEIDYVMICQQDVNLNVNKDEIQKAMYYTQDELKEFLRTADEKKVLITPWFRYILDNFLFDWWDNLDDLSNLRNNIIHRAGRQ